MTTFEIKLNNPVRLRMTAYIHPSAFVPDGRSMRLNRPAVIVCPGGGYMMRAEAEGGAVAMALAARGFNAFVLNYSVGGRAEYPTPVAQLALAVRYVREHAEEWDIGTGKIAVMGFSAGGHLAACLGVMWDRPEVIEASGATACEARPDALALIYPCIIADVQALGGMFAFLTGGMEHIEKAEKLSCERFVSPDTPPAFIAATYDDGIVPVEHAMSFANAMATNDRPFELHIFERGDHCQLNASSVSSFGSETLRRNSLRCFDMCADWLTDILGAPASLPGMSVGGGRAHLGQPRLSF